MDTITPRLGAIRRMDGAAGQISYVTSLDYGDGPERVEFVSSVYGGPVVMILSNGQQVFVDQPSRYGEFGPDWVRRFFA